jgi:hypothetical protein
MATTPTYINQRINNLQAQINALQPYPPPETQTLSDVLIQGNSAGATDIDMNHQDLTNVNEITFLNSNTTNVYSVGVNGNDFEIATGGDRLLLNSGSSIESTCSEFKIIGTSNSNNMNFNDAGNAWTATLTGGSDINFTQGDGRFRVGDVGSVGNGMMIDLDYQTGFKVFTGSGSGSIQRYFIDQTGLQTWEGGMGFDNVNNVLSFGKPQFACNYSTSGGTLSINSPYSQTINGIGQTLTLPVVTSGIVGIQYLITNTNASALTVNGSGGQFIYSSFGTAVVLTKSLTQGHSHIFTAIYTTGVGTFGWSMV